MDLKDFLIETLGDEQGKEVYSKLSKNNNYNLLVDDKKDSKYVSKNEYSQLEQDKINLEKQVKKNEKDLKELKASVSDNEELTNKIKTLEEDNKNLSIQYEKEKQELIFNHALDSAVGNVGAKNPTVLLKMLDKEKLKYIDGKVIGLDEQIKSLKETDNYLFNEPQPQPRIKGDPVDTLGKAGNNSTNKFVEELIAAKKQENSDDVNQFFK